MAYSKPVLSNIKVVAINTNFFVGQRAINNLTWWKMVFQMLANNMIHVVPIAHDMTVVTNLQYGMCEIDAIFGKDRRFLRLDAADKAEITKIHSAAPRAVMVSILSYWVRKFGCEQGNIALVDSDIEYMPTRDESFQFILADEKLQYLFMMLHKTVGIDTALQQIRAVAEGLGVPFDDVKRFEDHLVKYSFREPAPDRTTFTHIAFINLIKSVLDAGISAGEKLETLQNFQQHFAKLKYFPVNYPIGIARYYLRCLVAIACKKRTIANTTVSSGMRRMSVSIKKLASLSAAPAEPAGGTKSARALMEKLNEANYAAWRVLIVLACDDQGTYADHQYQVRDVTYGDLVRFSDFTAKQLKTSGLKSQIYQVPAPPSPKNTPPASPAAARRQPPEDASSSAC